MESWVVELTLQTRKAIAENIHDEANVLTSETLEHKLMREMDDVLEPVVER
jgi:hypothetical protein